MTGFRVIYWGHCWCRADFGGWVNAKVRPRWYWWLRRVRLFSVIVWRWCDLARLDWRTSWVVAGIAAIGLVGPMRCYPPPIDEARLAELDNKQL